MGNQTVGCLRFRLGCRAVAFCHEPSCSELHSEVPFGLGGGSWLGCGYCWPRGVVPSCRGSVARQV